MSDSDILSSYISDIDAAYSDLESSLKELKKLMPGMSPDDVRSQVATLAGRCGAFCAAASKVAKKTLIFDVLLEQKAKGLDITQTYADQSVKRVLGRSVSAKDTNRSFATPGRKASDRSKLKAEDLTEIEADIDEKLYGLIESMDVIRSRRREASRALMKSLNVPKKTKPAGKVDPPTPPSDENVIWGKFD